MRNKKYKALIVDVDGTLIQNKRNAVPSPKVTKAINKASKIIHVGLATSRPYFILSHIADHIRLSGPAITVGGAQIIDTKSKKILFEQTLFVNDVKEILKLSAGLNITIHINDNDEERVLSKNYMPIKPLQLWIPNMKTEKADEFIKRASHISTIAIHKVPSWEDGKIDAVITHASATKQHGILEVAKILNIETHEIIGVGDGYNDFPLLMACGLKVAMGNAVPEIKEIADYIAPSVDEDGVADVIKKFVL